MEMPKLPSDVRDIAEDMLKRVAAVPNVKVLLMSGDAAVAWLRDQILGTGPGTRKSGVKTGGVDSSFVRDALARVGDDPSKLVFVSGNAGDLNKTAK